MSDTSAYLRLTWGLLIVLGIILIFYALAKKRFSLLNSSEKNLIKVLEIRHLMPKKSICLIEVRGREYLLGIGADNVSLIAGLSQDSESTFAAILEKSTSATEK
ncbi:MAG: flagellar biosynthetic protein FliO [Desulfobulbaceae bacterium]|nr:MAG: flagellar biosynthetic protein FliO [Desulfobulbaceae bacterium]